MRNRAKVELESQSNLPAASAAAAPSGSEYELAGKDQQQRH
jgi:hypothetical protein